MSLLLLKESLIQVSDDLLEVGNSSLSYRSGGSLSEDSYNFYEKCITFGKEVQDAEELIDTRDYAIVIISNLTASIDSTNPDNVIFQGISMPFWHARLLALQSYCSTTWAIYDSLSKVAGKLICVDSVAKNEARPPKLPEDFLFGKNSVGARAHEHLKESYGWPIGFSYAIRNWLLHDGNSQDGTELFDSRDASIEPYKISDKAWDKLEEKCRTRYKVSECQTRLPDPWPWHRGGADRLLKTLQTEVDEAIGFLISWAVESVKSQARLLFFRDRA